MSVRAAHSGAALRVYTFAEAHGPRRLSGRWREARPATVEAGVWVPSASARGECVLPVHVDRRRLSSGTQFIGATA